MATSLLDRYLDPAESLAEILFGLIMVLTCTLGASLIAGFDRDALGRLLIAALGCNLAWGVIDAALYVMGNVFARSLNRRLMQTIRSAPATYSTALAIVRDTFEPRVALYGHDEDRERLYRSLHGMVSRSDALQAGITADDLRGAAAVFVLVLGSALPPAIPSSWSAIRWWRCAFPMPCWSPCCSSSALLVVPHRRQRMARRSGADAVRRISGRGRHRLRRLKRRGSAVRQRELKGPPLTARGRSLVDPVRGRFDNGRISDF